MVTDCTKLYNFSPKTKTLQTPYSWAFEAFSTEATTRFELALLFFPTKTEAVKTLISKLLRQRRLYFDEDKKH